MNKELLKKNWDELSTAQQRVVYIMAISPTERNMCTASGYLTGMRDVGAMDEDVHGFWLTVIALMHVDGDLCDAVLEMEG